MSCNGEQCRIAFREIVFQAAVLIVLLCIAFPGAFFRGEMLSPADLMYKSPPWSHYAPREWKDAQNPLMSDCLTAFLPWHYLHKQALKNGEWPLWNHLFMTGLPLLANCQSAVLYPPNLVCPLLDLHLATTLHILLKLWLCGMTAYLCGRVLKMGRWSARFLSIAWMLSAFNFVWCYWPIPDVAAWFPLIFMGTELILRGSLRRGFFAIAAGGTLALLAGHPESLTAFCIGLGVYLILRVVGSGKGLSWCVRALSLFGLAWAMACLVAAAQVIPFLEYLTHAAKSINDTNVGPKPGFDWPSVACLWIPRFFGTSADYNYWGNLDSNRSCMIYAGLPVWIAAAIAFSGHRNKKKDYPEQPNRIAEWFGNTRGMEICLAIAGSIALLLAFEVWPLSFIDNIFPLNLMKRTYHITFAMFALPVLAARGLDRWSPAENRVRQLIPAFALMIVMSLILVFLYEFHEPLIRTMRFESFLSRQFVIAVGIGLACLGTLIFASIMRRTGFVVPIFAVILAADLLIAGKGINPTIPRAWLYPDTALTKFLQAQSQPCRVGLSEGYVPPGLMTPYGIEDLLGYDALYPARLDRFQRSLGTKVWNSMEPVYGIRYYLNNPEAAPLFSIEDTSRFRRVGQYDGLEVYENLGTLPRAFLVGAARVVPKWEDMLDIMKNPAFKPGDTVLLERPLERPLSEAGQSNPGSAQITRRTGGRVNIRATAERPCILVLSDQYYPGWRATVDGEDTQIFPAYHAFRGLFLEAGEHDIEFRYRPWSFFGGLIVSLAAMAATFGVGNLLRG